MKNAKDLLKMIDNVDNMNESTISKKVQNVLQVLQKFFDIKGEKFSKNDQIMLVKQLANALTIQ